MTTTYNPSRIICTWNGILIQGFMDGTFVAAERYEDAVSLHVGAQGTATFVDNANESGSVTFTLAQSSITNDLLSAAVAAKASGPLLIKDLNGTTLISGADARLARPANVSYGKDLEPREWMVIVPKLQILAGGSLV